MVDFQESKMEKRKPKTVEEFLKMYSSGMKDTTHGAIKLFVESKKSTGVKYQGTKCYAALQLGEYPDIEEISIDTYGGYEGIYDDIQDFTISIRKGAKKIDFYSFDDLWELVKDYDPGKRKVKLIDIYRQR